MGFVSDYQYGEGLDLVNSPSYDHNGTTSGHAEVLKKLNTLGKDECTVDTVDKDRVLDNQVCPLQVSILKY